MYVTHTCIHIAHISEYKLFGPLYLHITEPSSCPFRYLASAISNTVCFFVQEIWLNQQWKFLFSYYYSKHPMLSRIADVKDWCKMLWLTAILIEAQLTLIISQIHTLYEVSALSRTVIFSKCRKFELLISTWSQAHFAFLNISFTDFPKFLFLFHNSDI